MAWDDKIPTHPDTGSVPYDVYGTEFNDNVNGQWVKRSYVMVDNVPFEDTIFDFHHVKNYNGTVRFVAKSSTWPEKTYNIFMSDFDDMIMFIEKGSLKATFEYYKRGQKYGLRLID